MQSARLLSWTNAIAYARNGNSVPTSGDTGFVAHVCNVRNGIGTLFCDASSIKIMVEGENSALAGEGETSQITKDLF
jgi:hypothetical protein